MLLRRGRCLLVTEQFTAMKPGIHSCPFATTNSYLSKMLPSLPTRNLTEQPSLPRNLTEHFVTVPLDGLRHGLHGSWLAFGERKYGKAYAERASFWFLETRTD